MDSHKNCASTLGHDQNLSPLGEDEEGLGAARDENEENHHG